MGDYERYRDALRDHDLPAAFVDLDAFETNAADLRRRAGGCPIRVASKSMRCRALIEWTLNQPGFHGVLSLTLPEALWLSDHGIEDVVVGYPSVNRGAIQRMVESDQLRGNVTLMVDDWAQVALLPPVAGAPWRLCVDVDAAWEPVGGRVHLGALRSPLHTVEQVAGFVRSLTARGDVHVAGVMAYEGQIAGLGNQPPSRLRAGAIRAIQSGSRRELAARRSDIVAGVNELLLAAGRPELEFVNGGGTGSMESTSSEAVITEIAAGSGLYGPTLFDTYAHFQPRPAAWFGLPVVRRPGPGAVTVQGGGYVASGAAGKDRLPTPTLPPGLKLTSQEGAGEAQTPLQGSPADSLAIGDPVFFRHCKAGELAEVFPTFLLVRGWHVVDEVPTYRGEGTPILTG